ncbi:MAG TPA: hypothetical protein VGR82_17495 [Methylomirabilota bacterium]|jgi:hypothetical protein|nr:hypothetical protein [Methylomirabilota bacterium]
MITTRPDRVLEVRCCCQPRRLLGWLPVPSNVQHPRPGVEVTFLVDQARVELESFSPFSRGHAAFDDLPRRVRHIPARRVTLRMAEWGDGELETRLAYKSEETSLEDLRKIVGFIEHVDA